MLWDIRLKFCVPLYFDAHKSKFECHQFPSFFAWVMPLFNFKILQICSFRTFLLHALTYWAEILHMNFVLLYYRTSSSVVHLRQFLLELCPFWNLEYWKYTVFRTFLLQAFTYWAEILHITLFYFPTDQVWVSSNCINFCGSYSPFGTKNTENTQFSALFSYMLWYIELQFCIWLCFTVVQIKFECRQFASCF